MALLLAKDNQNSSPKVEVLPDERDIIQWITTKVVSEQEQLAQEHLQLLLQVASQPRHESSNACVTLCYFLEQCSESSSTTLKNMAFSYSTCLDLFSFYVEWNEKNQHRSMRQVLELLARLIRFNPSKSAAQAVKSEVTQRLLSIVTHESAQPFVKPAFKVLECFLSKATISATELVDAHGESKFFRRCAVPTSRQSNKVTPGDSFVSAVFDWMSLPDTAPGAGKLLVTLFQALRKESSATAMDEFDPYTAMWQRWIRRGLSKYPKSLENIKNYLFPPLFKIDRSGSLKFLRDIAHGESLQELGHQDLNAQAFLLIAAMEVGKKSGLVDERSKVTLWISNSLQSLIMLGVSLQSRVKTRNFILLPETVIGGLLSHAFGSVRSSAFSVLVTSISSTRPFPTSTLVILKQKLGILHADTDAKIRNEVLSNTKNMFERLRGATTSLTRELAGSASVVTRKNQAQIKNSEPSEAANSMLINSLQEHKAFIQWYSHFLSNELVPTASYQRHITALRAIQIIINSGAVVTSSSMNSTFSLDSRAVWAFAIDMFTETMIRLLLDLIMDPFEDVRAAATEVLKYVPCDRFIAVDQLNTPEHEWSRFFQFPTKETPTTSNNGPRRRASSNVGYADKSPVSAAPTILFQLLMRAEEASRRTGRADLADGVSRTSELLCTLLGNHQKRLLFLESLVTSLEHKVEIAKKDLAKAVLLAPIHGQFASLRLVWGLITLPFDRINHTKERNLTIPDPQSNISENDKCWTDMQYRILSCCIAIWNAVRDVLCNDSPEGHLPDDIDKHDTIDTKDVLSYSFRAIHELSNLLGVMISRMDASSLDGSPILPYKAFRAAGDLSFEQLASLRHRGAFSTVSLTFEKCCQSAQELSIKVPLGELLLQEWYQGTLNCIQKQASTSRRSAGIPALMTGILSANLSSFAFEKAISELKDLARQPILFSEIDETNLPQVHATNCLKEIFKNSTLGKRCEKHITDCLQIAAESLKSKIWAIRNCGLLLLRSLIDCLFGTSESKVITEAGWDGRSIRLSYDRYPELPRLLLTLMDMGIDEKAVDGPRETSAVESVFPALDIIRRAGPPKDLREEIFVCITTHLGSKIWHVRDIAARTICTLLLHDDWLLEVINLLNTCQKSANQAHGVLMAVKYLIDRRVELNLNIASDELLILAEALEQIRPTVAYFKIGSEVATVYEDLATTIFEVVYFKNRSSPITDPGHPNVEFLLLNDNIFDRVSEFLKEVEYVTPKGSLITTESTTAPWKSSTLYFRAMVVRALYTARIQGQFNQIRQLIIFMLQRDADIACEVLDHLIIVCDIREVSPKIVADLLDIFIVALSIGSVGHIRSSVLGHIAGILEHLLEIGEWKRAVLLHKVYGSGVSLPKDGSPDVSNAEIRVTGSILAVDFLQHRDHGHFGEFLSQVDAWGQMLSANVKAEYDFDTRYAVVQSLRAFYCACYSELNSLHDKSFLLPSALVLYDTLNDDDDEIREMGANIVSRILGCCLVPLAACAEWLHWIHQHFLESENFCGIVFQRITDGNDKSNDKFESAERALANAMLMDHSLFIVEEQNLYRDEVSEIKAWTLLLVDLDKPQWDKTVDLLSLWAIEGLHTLTRLAESEDGPYGWASRPKVFSICMRIILTARAVLARHARGLANGNDIGSVAVMKDATTNGNGGNVLEDVKRLQAAMKRLYDVGNVNKLHPVLLREIG